MTITAIMIAPDLDTNCLPAFEKLFSLRWDTLTLPVRSKKPALTILEHVEDVLLDVADKSAYLIFCPAKHAEGIKSSFPVIVAGSSPEKSAADLLEKIKANKAKFDGIEFKAPTLKSILMEHIEKRKENELIHRYNTLIYANGSKRVFIASNFSKFVAGKIKSNYFCNAAGSSDQVKDAIEDIIKFLKRHDRYRSAFAEMENLSEKSSKHISRIAKEYGVDSFELAYFANRKDT